jgi:hypothetical protein
MAVEISTENFQQFPSVSTDSHFINPPLHIIILDTHLNITILMYLNAINLTISGTTT